MLQRFRNVAVLVALIGSFVAIPATSALAQGANNRNSKDGNRLDVPVTGLAQGVGTFAGTVSISRFAIQNDKLVAIGQLVGTVRDSNGAYVRNVVSSVTMDVRKAPSGAAGCSDEASALQQCDVLNLVLGPLDLNLLGLVIQLDTVVLDIFAVPGAGNLLGNLLCAIVGLFDAGSIGQQLVGLLNQLIGVLSGL